ncbi:MAG: hydroxymethylglutaryl-CoA lyase [Fimbriimonadaceae bacterium]|nr:hydroxymethylglutaryl-CoA lyase [Fimbriimonadaceae bacterium]
MASLRNGAGPFFRREGDVKVRIVEVGPRDGLQNEATPVSTQSKAAFVASLAAAGLHEIEATSFVSPKWVPQLGDAEELWPRLPTGPLYSALVPNLRGLERAVGLGVRRIALFTASSDLFTKRNINMTVEESLAVAGEVIRAFRKSVPEGFVRTYVSTAFECPYAGRMAPSVTAGVAGRLHDLGADEVAMGDTIGVASPSEVRSLASTLEVPLSKTAWHFHDTRGTAIANVAACLELGYSSFDSSAGGLGGCPYAKGAGGNLATEDLVYFCSREGFETGVDLPSLARASLPVLEAVGRSPFARAQLAVLAAS